MILRMENWCFTDSFLPVRLSQLCSGEKHDRSCLGSTAAKKRPVDRGLDHWQQPVAGVRCAAKTCRVGRLGFGSPHDVSIIILCLSVNSPGGCILILNCMNSTCVLFLFSSFFLHFRVHSLDFLLCLDIYNQLFLITFFFYRRLVSSYSLSLFSIRF